MQLPPPLETKLNELAGRYPIKRSALIPMMLYAQDEFGSLSDEILQEIATRLGIQTGTVKIHLKHIFEKTGCRGRYGLALSGLREKGQLVQAVM